MDDRTPSVLQVYARNIEHFAFRRGWSPARLARELSITPHSLNRVRFVRNKYIDPDLFIALMKTFSCEPNDLLLPQPGVDYNIVI